MTLQIPQSPPITKHHAAALLLTLAITLVVGVVFMPAFLYPGDAYAMRAEARALLTTGSLAVPTMETLGQETGQYYVENPRDGRMYSKYGVGNSLAFLPPLAVEYLLRGSLPYADPILRLQLLNGYNVLLSLTLAALLYQTCRKLALPAASCAMFTLACLFASFAWNYLRAQTVEIFQLNLTAAAFLLLLHLREKPTTRLLGGLWLVMTGMCLLRFSFVLPVAVVAGAVATLVWRNRQLLVLHVGCGVGLVLLLALLNYIKFGSPLATGYHIWRPDLHTPTLAQLPEGLWGFLFDPQRSIFLHFPLLLVAAVAWPGFFRRHRWFYGTVCGVFVITYVSTAALSSWRGENCYGPRYLLFILPQLALPAAAVLGDGRIWPKLLIYPLLLLSVLAQHQVNRLEYFAFYRVRAVFESQGFTRRQQWPPEITGVPFPLLNYRISQPEAPLDLTYGLDRYPLHQATMKRELRDTLQKLRAYPNFYWWQVREQ
jgi:hypothetical protein